MHLQIYTFHIQHDPRTEIQWTDVYKCHGWDACCFSYPFANCLCKLPDSQSSINIKKYDVCKTRLLVCCYPAVFQPVDPFYCPPHCYYDSVNQYILNNNNNNNNPVSFSQNCTGCPFAIESSSNYPGCDLQIGSVAEWFMRRTCDQQVAGSNPGRHAVKCNSGQVAYTLCLCHQAV